MSRNRAGFTYLRSRTSSRTIHAAAESCVRSATSTNRNQVAASLGERRTLFAICRRNSPPSGSFMIGRASCFRRKNGRLADSGFSTPGPAMASEASPKWFARHKRDLEPRSPADQRHVAACHSRSGLRRPAFELERGHHRKGEPQ
jgi:hypothetical protein